MNFGASDTTKTFTVTIIDDGELENDQTVTLTLSNPVGCTLAGTNNPATLSIISNDLASSLVYLNVNHIGPESGSLSAPYNTMGEALAVLNTSGTLRIFSGDIFFTGTLNTAMTLELHGAGLVRIGVFQAKSGLHLTDSGDYVDGTFDAAALLAAANAALLAGEESAIRSGSIYATVIPFAGEDGVSTARDTGGVLAIRIRAADAIDSGSIWSPDAADPDLEVAWKPAGDGAANDVWVLFRNGGGWTDGEARTLTAGAATVTGTPIEVTRAFAFDSGAADAEVPSVVDGLDAPAVIGPVEVYETPQRVWLPIPAGVDPASAGLFYYHASGGDAGWYPAEHVEGWLVPGSYRYLEVDGVVHLGFLVNHAGIVQLGVLE